jgi:hypothetical protein
MAGGSCVAAFLLKFRTTGCFISSTTSSVEWFVHGQSDQEGANPTTVV